MQASTRALVLLMSAAGIVPAAAAGDQASPAAGQGGMEEVVVTAQRRSERNLDVPLSVTSLSSEKLADQGVTKVMDLTQTVTGLVMDRIGGGVEPAIRGVSTQVTAPGSDSNVAIYLDGVYQPLASGNNFTLPDVTRVEVLKGPQGTLYGRNVTGGAIRVFTQEPTDTLTGRVAAGYGSFNGWNVKGNVAGPINDQFAYAISAAIERNDGYDKDLLRGGYANPLKAESFRGKLRWKPSENFSAQITGFYAYNSDASPFATTNLNGNTLGAFFGGSPIATKPHETATDERVALRTETFGGSLKLEGDLGFATLTSTSSAQKYDTPYNVDGDSSPVPIATYQSSVEHYGNYQQEFLLASNGPSQFEWVAGLYYYDLDTHSLLNVPSGFAPTTKVYKHVDTTAGAAFGELTIHFTDKLSGILGYRYSLEGVRLESVTDITGLITPATPLPLTAKKTWAGGTPRLSLRYEIDSQTNIYATYSTGFKSGLFDASFATPVSPEKIKAYEVGLKTAALHWLTLNAAVFYYDYKDQQVATNELVGGVPLSTTTNAGSSKIYGLDLDANVRVSSDFSGRIGVSILHARVDKYDNASVNFPTGFGGNAAAFINAAKKTDPRSPNWTAFVTINYDHSFSIGDVALSTTVYHSDHIFYDYANRVRQPAFTTLAASAAFSPANTHWRFSVTGKNLTDENYLIGTFETSLGDAVAYAEPRSVMGEISYSF